MPDGAAALIVHAEPTALAAAPWRPAALIEAAERMYRGIFGAGQSVALLMATYSLALFAISTDPAPAIAMWVYVALVVVCAGAVRWRAGLYGLLRRHPWGFAVLGGLLGAASFVCGQSNFSAFGALVMMLAVNGLAVPWWPLVAGSLATAVGFEAPRLLSSEPHTSIAVFPLLAIPLVTWRLIDQLVRYAVRIYQPSPGVESVAQRGGAAPGGRRTASGRARQRPWPLGRWPRQRALGAGSASRPGARTSLPKLTGRELEAVLATAEGLDHAQGAAVLGIGVQQFRRHLRHAREKTGSATTAQLIAWAMLEGLVAVPERSAPAAPSGKR